MIKVIKAETIETVDSACNKYCLSRFLIFNPETRLNFRLVRVNDIRYRLMHDKSNVLSYEDGSNYFGTLNEVINDIIDNGYKVYIDDKDL